MMVSSPPASILFFLFFLLPRLQTLLHSLGGKMPLSTQILIGSRTSRCTTASSSWSRS
jgi:type II secretory pathway component PulF